MEIIKYPEILLLSLITIALLCVWRSKIQKKSSVPTNWPLLGMLPGLLHNCHRVHNFVTEILSESGGTFLLKGPWFCNMDMLLTCDPANIHHIFSKNFSNYPKGPEFRKIFEILGDGIFNTDFELWEFHRRTTLSALTHPKFYTSLETAVWRKVENGLLPFLECVCKQGTDVDLQDVFQRFTFDVICKLILNCDPGSLSVDMPHVACDKAFNDTIDALLYRHFIPERIWKLQKWLGVGKEKKLKEAWKAFDQFIYPCIQEGEQKDGLNLLTGFRNAYEERNGSSSDSRRFLRDTALNLMLAGRDTTSTCLTWLFWLIGANPASEIKILEEIETLFKDKKWRNFNVEESRKLVYLHGALCESLRLFPPLALEHKAPIRGDDLPSGDYLGENTRAIVSFYSVGRMESVWGKDCLEFKPERWISESGRIKQEPSYKFPAFNVGPRTCLGKEMAFIQMKMVAATIIYHYKFQLVEGHPVSPSDSIILQAKHGLRVRLSKRNVRLMYGNFEFV